MEIDVITLKDLEQFSEKLIQEIKMIISNKDVAESEYLKTNDAKKLLQISTNSLQKLRIDGKIKRTKLGNRFYYKKSDLVDLLNGK
ncbi:MAG: helix-turn-helix domain-containing protein [Bacteroidia bacterium]